MGSFLSGALGTNSEYEPNQYQAGNPYDPEVLKNAVANQNQLYGQQQALAGVLNQQMMGGGPNPAQTQYQQNVNQNIANSQGLIASQRGLNPALAARMGASAASAANQQGASQASLLQQNQQLGAQAQLGGLYGNMANQNLGQQGLYTQGNANAMNANVNVAGGNQRQASNIVGGLFSGAGSAFMAGGGMVGDSQVANLKENYQPTIALEDNQDKKSGNNEQMKQMALMAAMAARGGKVAGKAEVAGDSYANDKVPTMLSPGEVVIPRSIAKADDAPEKSKEFVAQILNKNKSKHKSGSAFDIGKFKKIHEDANSATLHHPDGHKIVVSKKGLDVRGRAKLAEMPQALADGGSVGAGAEPGTWITKQDIADLMAKQKARDNASQASYNQEAAMSQPVDSGMNDLPMNQSSQQDYSVNNMTPENQDMAMSSEQPADGQDMAMNPDQSGGRAPASWLGDKLKEFALPFGAPTQPTAASTTPGAALPFGAPHGNLKPVSAPAPQVSAIQKKPAMPTNFALNQSRAPSGAMPAGPNMGQGYASDYGLVEKGMRNEALAKGQLGQQEAQQYEQNNAANQQLLDNYHKNVNALNTHINDQIQKINNNQIDPNHYMNSKGTGAKVSTAIGLILGGIGGGILGQENAALKFLNNNIDRDVDAQKANLGKQENLLSAYFRQTNNLHDATAMTKAFYLEKQANDIHKIAAQSASPIEKARADQAIGQLRLQKDQLLNSIAIRQTAMQGMANGAMDPAVFIARSGVVPDHDKNETMNELKASQNMVRSRENLMHAMDEVSKLQTLSNRILNPLQSPSQIEAIREPLLAQLSKDSAGRFTEADADALRKLFPTVSDDQETVNMKKQQMFKFISEKMNFPRLVGYGIPVPGMTPPPKRNLSMNR